MENETGIDTLPQEETTEADGGEASLHGNEPPVGNAPKETAPEGQTEPENEAGPEVQTESEAEAAPEGQPEPQPTAADVPAKKGKARGKKGLVDETDEEPIIPDTQILVLKTQVGQERRVADNLAGKARRFGLPVLSLLAPQELRGYVFIETSDPIRLEKGIRGVSYARALIKGPDGQPRDTPFSEIQHFLTPVSAVAKIAEGDIVELVSGPFRGEKAKVTRVDDAREEITVELIESMVPIPITVKGEHVRVLQKGKQ